MGSVAAAFAAVSALTALVVPASAQSHGINLAWDDCGVNGAVNHNGSPTLNFVCNSNSNANSMASTMMGSYLLGTPIPNLVCIDAVIDIETNTPAIVPWWSFDTNPTAPGCRAGQITFAFRSSGLSCLDWPGASPVTGNIAFQACINAENAARIRLVGGYSGGTPQLVPADEEHVAFTLTINNGLTVGAGSCPGCSTPACIVLRSLTIIQSPGPTLVITNPADGNNVTWFAGTSNCPGADDAGFFSCYTPTHRTTWGQVKEMYR
jgi:hypothetical protein